MTAFNAVRFRVKPGREQEFLDAHKKVAGQLAGPPACEHDQDGRAHATASSPSGRIWTR